MADLSPFVLALPDERATETLAARIAGRARPGDVIALSGPLGAGKTSFARAFIRARFGAAEEVPSPTFTLVEVYSGDGPSVWHLDLYRLDRAEDAWELGIEDAFADGVTLIEWPERLGALLPAEHLWIALAFADAPELELHPSSPPSNKNPLLPSGRRGQGEEGVAAPRSAPKWLKHPPHPALSPSGGEGSKRIATLTPSAAWAGRLGP